MTDLQILARGWASRNAFDLHADQQGIPVLTPNACIDCAHYAAALMRGADPVECVSLLCADAQMWHQDIIAAEHVARRVLG